MKYFATFHTHFGAISFQKKLTSLNIINKMMPVPRFLSASCGVGVEFSYDYELSKLKSADLFQIFSTENSEYKLLLENDD